MSDQSATETPNTEGTSGAPAAPSTEETAAPIEATAAPGAESVLAAESAPAPSPAAVAARIAAPKPSAFARPRPAAPAARPATPAAAAPLAPLSGADEALANAAREFGRVDDDGTVYVKDGDAERVVGQVATGTDNPLDLYVRRYLDLHTKAELLRARIQAGTGSANEMVKDAQHFSEEVAQPAAVGDLAALRTTAEELVAAAAQAAEEARAQREKAKTEAVAARTQIVERVEALAAQDPAHVQWRAASTELTELFDQWKAAQRGGVRLDRATEDALWKRFKAARQAFDKSRREFFARLTEENARAKATKELLVSEAEALAASTDWAHASSAYRDLMGRWKAAGHAGRKDDDALWARFKAAQDSFFAARTAANAQVDAEYAANLTVKEELLAQAKALLPVTNVAQAKRALRSIQEQWEAVGRVPRDAVRRVEGGLEEVERAIRDSERTQWSHSNPERRARVEGASSQLEASIAAMEADLEQAKAKGDARKIRDLEEGLAARRAWLAQILKSLD